MPPFLLADNRDYQIFPITRKGGETMPFAQVKVIEGVFSDAEKRQIIQKVTEALLAVEGESLREKTVVIIEEVKSGDWGIGGRALTTGDVKALRGAQSSA
jgi:4-oxalocrotonate tautomerase